jgi:hypothetical protein
MVGVGGSSPLGRTNIFLWYLPSFILSLLFYFSYLAVIYGSKPLDIMMSNQSFFTMVNPIYR